MIEKARTRSRSAHAGLLLLLAALLFSLAVTACGAGGEADEAPQGDGPALIMFYTDN